MSETTKATVFSTGAGEVLNPYRTAPLSCEHKSVTERVLRGGEGLDDASKELHCNDCGMEGWQWFDKTRSWVR
jgi:hypothetical protein